MVSPPMWQRTVQRCQAMATHRQGRQNWLHSNCQLQDGHVPWGAGKMLNTGSDQHNNSCVAVLCTYC